MAPTEKGNKATKGKPQKFTEKTSNLSAEYIVDSDSEEEDRPASPKPKATSPKPKAASAKPKTSPSKPKKKDLNSAKSGSTTRKDYHNAPRTPTPGSSPSPVITKTNGTAAKANGIRKDQSSSETSDSDSDSGEDESSTARAKSNVPSTPQAKRLSQNAESKLLNNSKRKEALRQPLPLPGDDLSSDSSGSSDDESQERTGKASESEEQVFHSSNKHKLTVHCRLIARADPVTEYIPPEGFSKAKFKVSSDISRIFSQENLKGKKLWHITVPASVSISQIEEISTRSLERGDVVLSHKGVDYGFTKEKVKGETAFVPAASGKTFDAVPEPVSHILHLHRKVKLPELERPNRDPSSQMSPNRTFTKPKPEQPAGLRMRYRPFGDVDSDDEVAERTIRPPQFRMPLGTSTTSRNDKRKALDDLDADVAEETSPKKKRKKARLQHATQESDEADNSLPNGNQVPQSSTTAEEGSSQARKHSGETAEERAARKAAKAKRKEQKMHRQREKA